MNTEFIRDPSARVTIVSCVSVPPFSAGILVRRAVTKIVVDIRRFEARVLYR